MVVYEVLSESVASSHGLQMGHAGADKAVCAASVPSVLHLQTLGVCVGSVDDLHGNICVHPSANGLKAF